MVGKLQGKAKNYPHDCRKCGRKTRKITTGRWAGTYHCSPCGTYQGGFA